MDLSRRGFMLVLAATAVAPMSKSAQAQADTWREYRRDDLGFRIEMPGEPRVEAEEDESKDVWRRSVNVEIDYQEMSLGVTWTEYRDAVPVGETSKAFRDAMRGAGLEVTRETALAMNGFPARELIGESDQLNFIYREVILGNVAIAAAVFGDRGIHTSPAMRRFMESFQLLRQR